MAGRCDPTAHLVPHERTAQACLRLVDADRLKEAVSCYIDWEAFAYWVRPALDRSRRLPTEVTQELNRRCPGFLIDSKEQHVFDRPQPPEVMARLREIVASAQLSPGAVVLDVGTGVGVLVPLIQSYQPAAVLACDVAEKMLQRVHDKYPAVRTFHTDVEPDVALPRINLTFRHIEHQGILTAKFGDF